MVDEKNLAEIRSADEITRQYRNYRDEIMGKDRQEHMRQFPIFGVFHSNNKEPELPKKYLRDLMMIPDKNFIFDESRCEDFVKIRGYYNYTVTDEEKAFPLAFTIRTYEQVEQLERLLRTIYRPQNVYCIHVDARSNEKFKQAVQSISRCFPNVFIATKLEKVFWGSHTVLLADINCMKDLIMPSLSSNSSLNSSQTDINKFWSHEHLKNKNITQNWKYLFNMASTEFPIRTNRELVQIMKIYNGTNDIELKTFPVDNRDRIDFHWVVDKSEDSASKTDIKKSPPPFNYTIVKNLAYSAFSRAFIEFALSSKESQALLDWLADTIISDESYWGTLQYNTQFKPPGSFETIDLRGYLPHMSRFMGWPGVNECHGYRRHAICILSNGDLNHVTKLPYFFVNKFQLIDDPVAYSCIEDWYARQHQRENRLTKARNNLVIDMTPYCEHLYKRSSGNIYKGCENFLREKNS